MKIIYTILLTILSNLALAQFAVIDDKDGYSNVRRTAEIGNNIQDKLENGHFVYCMETTGSWVNVDYDLKGRENINNGYVYKDRLKVVTTFEKVGMISKGTYNSLFKNDSIKVTVTSQPFDKTKHTFTKDKDGSNYVGSIDGKHCYGTDGTLPTVEYKAITVAWGSKTMMLPKSAIQNLFEAHINKMEVNYDKANNTLYIQADAGDAAGSYFVIWKIVNGVYKERYIAYGF
jgi:hypothetical protein